MQKRRFFSEVQSDQQLQRVWSKLFKFKLYYFLIFFIACCANSITLFGSILAIIVLKTSPFHRWSTMWSPTSNWIWKRLKLSLRAQKSSELKLLKMKVTSYLQTSVTIGVIFVTVYNENNYITSQLFHHMLLVFFLIE